MPRPLIAVSCRPRAAGEVKNWPDTPSAVMQYTYLDALWNAGGDEAIVAPRLTDREAMCAYLSRFDGLMLVGGGDIDPAHYGQEREHEVYGVEATSDSLEISMIGAAIELGLPTLAICRGLQVLNVARGGTLVQHLTGKAPFQAHGQPGEGFAVHSVSVTPGSQLAKSQGGASTIEHCWSYHHQVIDELGEGLCVTARAEDGAIEGVELVDPSAWLVAVQWHPERTAGNDLAQQALFEELVRQAGAYRSARPSNG
jgi:putative glutamine amidotransferase